MSDTLERVRRITSEHSGVPIDRLSTSSALAQDVKISGDDIDELAEAFSREFGVDVYRWPWQRFVELSEPHGLLLFVFIWRLLSWPFRGRLFNPSPFERLELGHIAAVIDRGEWFEP